MSPRIASTLLFLGALCPLGAVTAEAASEPPRLVLQITVDQLRGDQLTRYRDKFGAGGFRLLLERGVTFSNAHYGTANTFTASGHAVLATGADTAAHGIVSNDWWDRATGQPVYCTADSRYPALGEPSRPGTGLSPANLSATTLGDEIVSAGGGRSRAFAIAGKDRSAIIPGGHLGQAFWWSEHTGGFASSTYYFSALPPWVSAWNATRPSDRYRGVDWKPLRDPASYRFASAAANLHARPNATLGRTFPHPLLAASQPLFLSALRYTPFLDETTAAFARELITREKLGRTGSTDYLSVSFSGHDYIGHAYGPNSMEAEDSLLRLDVTLAALFAHLDETVGLGHTVIVLSADHGVDEIPEARRALGFNAERIYPEKFRAAANTALRERLRVDADLVAAFVPPGFYLDAPKLAALNLVPAKVEAALADHLRSARGVAHALTRTDLLAGRVPATELFAKVLRAFHPTRSGDVVIVQEPFWYLYPDAEAYAAMHGSPYAYDTFVPVLILAPGVPPGINHTAVSPAQIAPTLAALLGLTPPSGSASPALLPGIVRQP